MYWWNHAASLVRSGETQRFGFITTNSLQQAFNRRVVEKHLGSKRQLSLVFAIPDHPWVDDTGSADVRIAMTVGLLGASSGSLHSVISKEESTGEPTIRFLHRSGIIHANLRVGADVANTTPLRANDGLSCPGVKLHGAGFIITRSEAERLGLGRVVGAENHIRRYLNGRDVTRKSRNALVIDLFGLTSQQVQASFPEIYQWISERVKPDRMARADRTPDAAQYARQWWLFGKPRPELRKAIHDLKRYIATVETAKHRFFVFLDRAILADNMLVNIALADAYFLGVLSCRIHVTWALAAGGRLGIGNDPRYNKTRCFDPFPFPDCGEEQKAHIRELGERLDAHRKDRQALHPDLTMTGMYNVLQKLHAGETLTTKEKDIHEKGLVSVLNQIHDDLDETVFAAYGWSSDLSDEQILERLVALNQERAEEEARGIVRWLRPEFQNPDGRQVATQARFAVETAATAPKAKKAPWPKALPEQVQAVRTALATHMRPATAEDLAREFSRAPRGRVTELLETLASLGQARKLDDGRYLG